MNLKLQDLRSKHFRMKIDPNGRLCYSFNYLSNVEIDENVSSMQFWFTNYDALDVYIHPPGNFYGSEPKLIYARVAHEITTTISHEIVEVLDFDDEPCSDYETGRDTCIESITYEVNSGQIDRAGSD